MYIKLILVASQYGKDYLETAEKFIKKALNIFNQYKYIESYTCLKI